MSEIKEILGNQTNLSQLRSACLQGRLPHAYIVHGAAGSGKKTFAAYLAAMLLCEQGAQQGPCGICPSCIKAATHNHPDIIWTTHEKPSVLSVQEIRDQVVNTIFTPPYYGPYKIYIIDDAQLLNEHGQNALLKTMEEPPAYALLLLLTDNADALLDTIRSRCIRMDMQTLAREQIEAVLLAAGATKGEAAECAAFARGNLGLAKELFSGGALRVYKDETVQILKNIKHEDALQIFNYATKQDKKSAAAVLAIMLKWYRDVLLIKTGAVNENLYFAPDKAVLAQRAAELSYESLGRIIRQIEACTHRLEFSVKPEAAIETLLLQIREEHK